MARASYGGGVGVVIRRLSGSLLDTGLTIPLLRVDNLTERNRKKQACKPRAQVGADAGAPRPASGDGGRVGPARPAAGPLRARPQSAQQAPRVGRRQAHPNSRRISSRAISRVHRANSNHNCVRSDPRDRPVQAAPPGAVQLRRLARHRPGPQRPAGRPPGTWPPEYRAPGHPSVAVTTAGCSPSTCGTPHLQHLERRVIQLAAVVRA
jgi:hypothetical protein